jgi:hypothetical protein
VREPDYAAHPSLDRVLTLRAGASDGPADAGRAADAWSAALGGRRVLLVRSVDRARALLLQAAGVRPGEPVGVPANATQSLVEALKRHGARPRFLDLDADLIARASPDRLAGVRIAWAQPVGGLAPAADLPGPALWVDHADSLPAPTDGHVRPAEQARSAGRSPGVPTADARVTLWGLHLSPDPSDAGALLAFGDGREQPDLHAAVAALLRSDDLPSPARALAQCRRFVGTGGRPGLAHRQGDRLEETRRGLQEAAGLPLLPADGGSALAQHVAVRIPDESDATTFYAYVCGENTPVRWLPLVRPLHHAALGAAGAATAANLARWLLVPVGPDYADAEIGHAVLGVVKASEYLGVRWRTDPARALAYAALLTERYGPDHDAYRPVFEVDGRR